MDFYEILDQVTDLLRSRGRVSYRALQRQFDLDDDYIEDLKVELIDVQELATDRDNKMLVWTGETAGTFVSSSQPTKASQQPAFQESLSTQSGLPISASPTPDAERRQLTVMFCDLADSTKLSVQLDPEDLRDVIRAYQSTSTEVIERYDGYIAQHLGDGLMVYFGWPQAHEDDAQRAVHAGLGILAAMQGLNSRLEQEKGIRLTVRIGIHTGLVVVGEMGQGASQEHLALGETPNVASRIEGIAEPDTVAISEATYQLMQGFFVCEDLGQHALKGVNEPQQVYRAVKESDTQSRFEVAATRGLTPLVGRESETTLLLERWQQVKDGQGQVVLLSGEGGIGKSRLVQVLRDHITDEPHTRLECRSSPYYQNTALSPITDLLQRTLQWQPGDTPQARLEKLECLLQLYQLPLAETLPLFATLLSLPVSEDHYPPPNLTPQQQRQKTLATIIAMVLQQAERRPVLFILEDLHWTDPSTLELLNLLIDQTPTTAICVLLTCRPEFEPPWGLRSHLTPIALNRFTRPQIEAMVAHVAGGKHLPAEVMQHLLEKTDGVPLFVEEMTKAILEAGVLEETNGHYDLSGPLASLSIPATLQDSLMSRLDRLDTARSVAQLGATIGRQFSYELLRAIAPGDEATLQQELGRLVGAELVYQRGVPPLATYLFKHALIQDTAYQSLLRQTRQQYHQQIAQIFEVQFPEVKETQPELVAHHYTEAGRYQQAVNYWQRAGERDVQRSANLEAVKNFKRGLELLSDLPDNPERLRQELDMQVTLGPALLATRGTALEVEQTYARAHELCRQLGDSPRIFPVLWGLCRFYWGWGEFAKARELGDELLDLAQRADESSLLLQAHHAYWTLLSGGDDFQATLHHAQQGIAFYNLEEHRTLARSYGGHDPGVCAQCYTAQSLWFLGYADQALQHANESVALAQELSHPFSLVLALSLSSRLHQFRREAQMVKTLAEAIISASTEHNYAFYLASGHILRGWVIAMEGASDEGIEEIQQGLSLSRSIGESRYMPHHLALLAEAYGQTGDPRQGLDALAEAFGIIDKGQRRWEAECYRLMGEFMMSPFINDQQQGESCFHQALSIARNQQAKSLELRAATSLARLWQSQGNCQDAYDLVHPVYGWFTEGFDTADLKDANVLLQELEG